MAHWGLSRIYSGLDDHANAVKEAMRARELGSKASPREQRRIALRLQQLEAIADLGNADLFAAYKQAIDKAIAADIEDAELWLIRGNAEEPTAAGRGQRGGVASTAFYLEALRVAPDNGAAHHYLTHSYENLNQIGRALEHGEVYARIAADIPHAHHMWGHDLRRVGRLDEAIAAFTRTNELEDAYYAAEKIGRRARLASRAQPRPARDVARAQGADAQGRSAAARGRGREAVDRIPGVQPEIADGISAGPAALARSAGGAQKLTKANEPGNASGRVSHLPGTPISRCAMRRPRSAELASAEAEMQNVPTLVAGISVGRATVVPYVDALRAEILLREGKTRGRPRAHEGRARHDCAPCRDPMPGRRRCSGSKRLRESRATWVTGSWRSTPRGKCSSTMALMPEATLRWRWWRANGASSSSRRVKRRRRAKYWKDADRDMKELALLRDKQFASN